MKVYKTQNEIDTLEFKNGSTTVAIGTGVSLNTSGVLVADHTTPHFLCLEGAEPNEERVLVHPINKDEIYSVAMTSTIASLSAGSVITLKSAGTSGELAYETIAGAIDGTNGVFTVLEVKENGATGTVIGKLK